MAAFPAARRLIVNADDFGRSPSINDAVADLGDDIGEAFTGFQRFLYQGVA